MTAPAPITREIFRLAKPFGLTHMELDLVDNFLRGESPEKAALLAGYAKSTAEKKANAILKKPRIREFLRVRAEMLHEGERMGTAEIMARVARIARMDPRTFFNEDGSPKSPTELTADQAYALRGFEVSQEDFGSGENARFKETKKLRLADPLPALKLAAQIEKLVGGDQTTVNIFMNMDARLDAARRRRLEQKQRAIERSVVSEQ